MVKPARRGLVLVLLLLALAPPPALAAPPRIVVHSFALRGVKHLSASEIKSVLATQATSWLPFARKHYFDRPQFDADLKRIVAYYVDHGFPDARIVSSDVKLNHAQNRVDLTVDVAEGRPIIVTTVAFRGFEELPAAEQQSLHARSSIKPGARLELAAVQATRQAAQNLLRDHGYAYATVTATEQRTNDPYAAGVTFTAEPGLQAYFGPITIVGNTTVSDQVVRRELLYKPGELFDRSLVLRSQRRLYDLELFRFVTIQMPRTGQPPATGKAAGQEGGAPAGAAESPAAAGQAGTGQSGGRAGTEQAGNGQGRAGQSAASRASTLPPLTAQNPSEVPTRVVVAEGKPRRVNFSAGYGTEEKVRGEVQWHHYNFFGGGQTLGVRAKWSSLDRGVRADFTQPYVLGPNLSFNLEGHRWYDDEPAYSLTSSGAKATLTYRDRRSFTWSLGYVNEYENSRISSAALSDLSLRNDLIALGLDPVTGEQTGTLSALVLDAQRVTATNPLNPASGSFIWAHVEQAAHLVTGTYNYTNVSMDLRHYLPLGNRVVWANRARAGAIRPAGNRPSEVPFFKRYFLGGAESLRGWGRYEVSPLSGGLPTGGFTMLEATSELRMILHGNLGAVAFLDLGNVWSDAWHVDLGTLRYDVGPGFRYRTPVGPVRIDVGYQLNPLPGLLVDGAPQTRRWRIHFSIGQAF
jgi:outer membrane protein assembly factor BamA